MTKHVLTALNGSIEKWRKIANGTGIDFGPQDCPLCKLFYNDDCEGCPVAEKTGEIECWGSPYERWNALPDSAFSVDGRATSIRARKAAEAELNFLKSLLPKTTKK